MIYLAPDELTPAAECAIVHRLLEDGDDPNAWTVAHVWAVPRKIFGSWGGSLLPRSETPVPGTPPIPPPLTLNL